MGVTLVKGRPHHKYDTDVESVAGGDSDSDVQIIGALYSRLRLMRKSVPSGRPSLELIKAASARYMRSWPSRELKELHVPLDLAKFVPLDVLHAPTPHSPRYRCRRCERMLSLPCFFTRSVKL